MYTYMKCRPTISEIHEETENEKYGTDKARHTALHMYGIYIVNESVCSGWLLHTF